MKFAIGYQLLSGRIFIGRLNKAQNAFLDGKEDHTDQAVWSAAEYVIAKHGGEMEITNGHGVTLRIRAEEITGGDARAD